jgi:hypothetical protein
MQEIGHGDTLTGATRGGECVSKASQKPKNRNGTVISLNGEDSAVYSFRGEKIAEASSRSESSKRWSEVAIYRDDDAGEYVAHEIGRSIVPGEIDRYRVKRGSARDVYMALTRNGERMTLLAEEALALASDRDPVFARELGDVLDYEDVPTPAAGVSMMPSAQVQQYIVERDNARPLRFFGALLGRGSSRIEDASTWTEFTLYRLLDGRILAAKQQIDATAPEPLRRSSVVFASDVATIVRAYAREGVGWVEGALLDAIYDATERDRAIAAEVGGNAAAWAHGIVGSTRVQVNDARYRVLALLRAGALLVTRDTESSMQVLGWRNAPAGADVPPKPVFLALSRQRLVRQTERPEASGTFEWTISPKGLAVFTEANAAANAAAQKAARKGR